MKASNHSDSARVDLIDYARFLAAFSVVCFHYFFGAIQAHHVPGISVFPYVTAVSRYGYLGVQLFFMISGYVIFYSACSRTASEFASARILRLYPAYLAALSLTAAICLFGQDPIHTVYPSQFLANLTMLPELFRRAPLDLSYWTLPYEIYFYGLVLMFLLFSTVRSLKKFFLIWPFLILISSFMGGDSWIILGGYYSFFAAGALFAMKEGSGSQILNLSLLLCFYESLKFSILKAQNEATFIPVNVFILISIICLFYALFCILGNQAIRKIQLPLARQLGSLTYPLYLLHQWIGYIFLNHTATETNKFFTFSLMILLALILAYLVNQIVEVRFFYLWRRLIDTYIGTPMKKFDRVKY